MTWYFIGCDAKFGPKSITMGHSMLDQIIWNNFPHTGVSLAFGYGSKVIKQGGKQSGNDLVDIIFAVDDSIQWHKENLSRNNQHYSSVRYLSRNAEMISQIQENNGAKIYYNPYIKIANLSIKYGVIRTDHLIEDLLSWDSLYVAGRLHKPVEFLVNTCDKNERLRTAMRFNKESAIRAAMLQLPETFEPMQLYKVITGLSYRGDIRMLFGEDKNKIENIVSRQVERFDQLYLPIIKMSNSFKDSIQWNESRRMFTQDVSPQTLLKNLKLLPKTVRRKVCEIHGSEARTLENDIVLASLSKNINCDKVIEKAIASIVRRSSFSQSLKGLLTAGFVKSLKYTYRKLLKSIASRAA